MKLSQGEKRVKGDERILGENQFVLATLRDAEEGFERKYQLKDRGYDPKVLGQCVEKKI